MKALIAMSGGVDSSVAAAMMLEEGHELIGVTMKMWKGPNGEAPTAGCCTVSDAEDARRVAAQLDIPYYVLDYTDEFMGGVIDRFVDDYAEGRTPNPCVECNRTVKFSRLVDHAADLDCEVVVTGHYARTSFDGSRWHLMRGVDMAKDQSYVLSMLGQEQLERVRFPIGGLTKAQTREVASGLGLRTAAKAESQDICFVGTGNYRDFLRTHGVESRPGPIVDENGEVIGSHDGIANFTIGQRKGLGVALGEPRFVTDVDRHTSTVKIGRRADLEVRALELEQVEWVDKPVSDNVLIQYRAHGDPVPGKVKRVGDGWFIDFESPQTAVAAGQTVAFYHGDEVLGGGIIASAT